VILFLAVLAILYFSRSVIPILIFAALLAFLIQPIVRFFQNRLKLKRGLSVTLTFVVVVLALALIPLIVLPALIDAVNSFVTVDYQSMLEGVIRRIEELSASAIGLPFVGTAVAPLLDSIVVSLQAIASGEGPQPVSYTITLSEAGGILAGMFGRLAKVMGPVVSAMTSLVFTLLISLYLSLSGDQIRDWYPKLIPPGYGPEITALLGRIGDVWSAFLGGQFLLMALIGVVVWLGNLALGNSNALLLGMISGMMELIPNIGPAIALVPGVLMALLFGSSHFAVDPLIFALIVLSFYLLVQFLENQFIVPRIMGDAVDLPPLVVLIGVFVGASTVGIWGVLLSTPIIATGREVFLYLYNKILEPPEPAFPPQEEPSLIDSLRGLVRRVGLTAGLRSRQSPPPGEEGVAVAQGPVPAVPQGQAPGTSATGSGTLAATAPEQPGSSAFTGQVPETEGAASQ
jgi:predicted PurR-regulated permease PerM